MNHYLSRATIIPSIINLIMEKYQLNQNDALKAFYSSATGASLADDDTGLYGQSPLFIFGLYIQEIDETKKRI